MTHAPHARPKGGRVDLPPCFPPTTPHMPAMEKGPTMRHDPPPLRRLVAPPYLPTPKPLAEDLTTPGNPLVADKPGSALAAATALFCWTQAARSAQDTGWAIPHHMVEDAIALYTDHPLPTPAACIFQRKAQQAGILWLFPDASVLLGEADVVETAKGKMLGMVRPFPVPLRVATTLAITQGPRVSSWGVDKDGKPTAKTGSRHVIVDAKSPHRNGQLLWAALVRGAVQWLEAQRPQARCAQPIGPDWGQDAHGTWIVPPHLPHSALTAEQIKAVQDHLTHAGVLIDALFADSTLDWAGAVRARGRTLKGDLAQAVTEFQALSAATGRRDGALEKRIGSAWIKALRHPACPVPYTQLHSTTAYTNGAKGSKNRVLCLPTLLWNGRKTTHSAHTRLAALAALGGDSWLR